MLLGLALLLTFLPTELSFFQTRFNLTSLTGYQWLICAGLALVLLLMTEVVKIFLRRSRGHTTADEGAVPVSGPSPAA